MSSGVRDTEQSPSFTSACASELWSLDRDYFQLGRSIILFKGLLYLQLSDFSLSSSFVEQGSLSRRDAKISLLSVCVLYQGFNSSATLPYLTGTDVYAFTSPSLLSKHKQQNTVTARREPEGQCPEPEMSAN